MQQSQNVQDGSLSHIQPALKNDEIMFTRLPMRDKDSPEKIEKKILCAKGFMEQFQNVSESSRYQVLHILTISRKSVHPFLRNVAYRQTETDRQTDSKTDRQTDKPTGNGENITFAMAEVIRYSDMLTWFSPPPQCHWNLVLKFPITKIPTPFGFSSQWINNTETVFSLPSLSLYIYIYMYIYNILYICVCHQGMYSWWIKLIEFINLSHFFTNVVCNQVTHDLTVYQGIYSFSICSGIAILGLTFSHNVE